MHIVKDVFTNFDTFLAQYRADEERFGAQSPALIHFRIATGSAVDQENCHPFKIRNGAMIHNGWFFPSTREKSDTNLMAAAVSGWMNYTAAQNGKVALNKHFGNNKVIVLFKDKRWVIFNEEKGDWVDGIWYSNGAWKDSGRLCNYNPAPRTTPRNVLQDITTYDRPAYHMGAAHRHGMMGEG